MMAAQAWSVTVRAGLRLIRDNAQFPCRPPELSEPGHATEPLARPRVRWFRLAAANTLALELSNLISSILVTVSIPDPCRPGPGAARACGAGSRAWQGCRVLGAPEEVVGRLEGVGLPNVESPLADVL